GREGALWRISRQRAGGGRGVGNPHRAAPYRARPPGGEVRPAFPGKANAGALRPLAEIAGRLEAHFRDMQDLEFTIERGKLWMLHTRTGKRTTRAALRMAVEMAEEGLISRAEALCRIDPGALDSFLHPTIDPEAQGEVIAVGLPASPGAVTGEIVFSSEEAERM